MVTDGPLPESKPSGGEGEHQQLAAAKDQARTLFGVPIVPKPDVLHTQELPPEFQGADKKERILIAGGYHMLRGFDKDPVKQREKVERFVKGYALLRDAGLTVVPGVQIVQDTDDNILILSPDITDNGEEAAIYGKARVLELLTFTSKPKPPSQKATDFDALFVKIMAEERGALVSKADSIAELATAASIRFAKDDAWEMVVYKNGTWELVFLDPEFVEQGKKEDQEAIGEFNTKMTQATIDILDDLPRHFQKQPEAKLPSSGVPQGE